MKSTERSQLSAGKRASNSGTGLATAASRARKRWETPRVESSEVFTRAGLACCIDDNNQIVGSAGANLPFCFEL